MRGDSGWLLSNWSMGLSSRMVNAVAGGGGRTVVRDQELGPWCYH